MASATFSQQELERNFHAAEEATHAGPVFITRDGEARCVLMDITAFRLLSGPPPLEPMSRPGAKNLAELLAVPEDEYFEWEPPRLRGRLSRPID